MTSTEQADAERAQSRADFIRSSNRRIWRIVIVACAAILGLGLATASVIQGNADRAREQHIAAAEKRRDDELRAQQAADIACVKRWADAYTRRADRLNELSQPRADALDRLAASIPAHDPVLFRTRLDEYLAASLQYKAEQAANPLPPSPTFACGLEPRRGPTPYAPNATSVPVPSPRPSKTPSTSRRPSTPDASPTAAAAARPNLAPVASRPGRASSSSRARATPTESEGHHGGDGGGGSGDGPGGPRSIICTLPALPPLLSLVHLC